MHRVFYEELVEIDKPELNTKASVGTEQETSIRQADLVLFNQEYWDSTY